MASESTALIRVEDSRPEPEPSDSIVPLHRRNTLTVMYSGPGLSMLQLATYGGKAFQSIANYCFSGPKNPKLWIDNFFGNDGERQAALDNLHHHNRKLPTTPAIQKHHKELRNRCHKLLSYARPQSHTVDTQLVTFKMLVAIIPRYPGIRVLFHDHKDLRGASLNDLWKRDQDCGTEWIFYRDFAVFCITDSGPLTVLVEGKLPSKLGRLELVGGNLSTVPTEALLADCRSGPEFDPPRLCAIRYLAGILELRSFWLQCKANPTRFYDVLCDIYDTILQLIQDTEVDVADEDCLVIPWLPAARNALDVLACTALDGLLALDSFKCLDCLPRCPPQLPNIVVFFMRDQKTPKRFPKASAPASSVNFILQYPAPRNTEDEQEVNRAPSPHPEAPASVTETLLPSDFIQNAAIGLDEDAAPAPPVNSISEHALSQEAENVSSHHDEAPTSATKWYYRDPKNAIHGPWMASLMQAWYKDGLLPPNLPVRREEDADYVLLKDLRLQSVDPAHPFRTPPPPAQPSAPEPTFPETEKNLFPSDLTRNGPNMMRRTQAENEEWLDAEIDGSQGGMEQLANAALSQPPESSGFWIPQVTSDGQIYYVNTKTGQRARDLPNEDDEDTPGKDLAGFAASQSSPRSGTSGLSNGLPQGSREMTSTAGFGLLRRTGTPEPWVKKLADDGMSYYYYNESDGSVQWTRPGPTQTADRSLPSSTTRPTINNNSTPPPGIPPPPRTAPKVSRLSTYSDDSDISGRNGGASHREGDKDISIEDDTAEEEINRAPSPHAEAPALAAENQLSSDSILSGLGEFKGPLRGDGDMNFERNQSASSSSVYYTARSSSPTKPFGSGRFSVGGADMKTSDPPVRVKVYFQDDIFVILVPRMTEYDELVAKVQRKMLLCGPRRDDGPLRIKYRDEDGDMVSLGSTEDVQMAFEQYRPGGCVTLHAT